MRLTVPVPVPYRYPGAHHTCFGTTGGPFVTLTKGTGYRRAPSEPLHWHRLAMQHSMPHRNVEVSFQHGEQWSAQHSGGAGRLLQVM